MNVHFDNGALGHFHLNWLAPEKVRCMVVCGTRGMIVYDDLRSVDKVRVYDKSVSIQPALDEPLTQTVIYHSGEPYVPIIDSTEPLSLLMLAGGALVIGATWLVVGESSPERPG